MNEWREYKLGDIADFFSGGTPSKNIAGYWDGPIPWISAKTMTDYKVNSSDLNISIEGLKSGSRLAQIGDILLLVRGSGLFIDVPINLVETSVAFNQDIKAIRAKDKTLQEYLFFWLKANKKKLEDILEETGIGAGKFDTELVKNLEVSLPGDRERKTLIEFAKALFDKIDLLHRQNTTLEKMAETLFRQWFVEEAKEEWEMGMVEKIATHLKVPVQPQKNPQIEYKHYSIPAFDNSKKPTIEFGQDIQSNKYLVPQNCILFSKLNPNKDKRVWLLQDEVTENSVCSTEFQIVKPNKGSYLYFLYGWLTYTENYNEIASGVGGTSGSHQRIDPATIFRFHCPIIPEELVIRFNAEIEVLFRKQVTNQTQIRTLTTLRDTLLPKLMSGEVKVE